MPTVKIVTDIRENANHIFNQVERLEKGFRAIAVGYNEHIDDENSFDNINILRDSIGYRLFAAREQYIIYTSGILKAEKEILEMVIQNKKNGITPGSQTFIEINNELNLSSYFDNIIFNLCSALDYQAHLVSYCLYKNKDRTFAWDKLVKKATADTKLKSLEIIKTMDDINRNVVQGLYDCKKRS